MTRAPALARWYREHGRHDLPWRASTDRWPVLVSEVMLQQTQVARVLAAWPGFIVRFAAPAAMATAPAGAVIAAWDRLGYPRRALRLWESARMIAATGWPDDLTALPGVGRYTARAIRAQADGEDVAAVEVNVGRVVQRVEGTMLGAAGAEAASVRIGDGSGGHRVHRAGTRMRVVSAPASVRDAGAAARRGPGPTASLRGLFPPAPRGGDGPPPGGSGRRHRRARRRRPRVPHRRRPGRGRRRRRPPPLTEPQPPCPM